MTFSNYLLNVSEPLKFTVTLYVLFPWVLWNLKLIKEISLNRMFNEVFQPSSVVEKFFGALLLAPYFIAKIPALLFFVAFLTRSIPVVQYALVLLMGASWIFLNMKAIKEISLNQMYCEVFQPCSVFQRIVGAVLLAPYFVVMSVYTLATSVWEAMS